MAKRGERFLVVYSGVLTVVLAGTVLLAAAPAKHPSFDEIDVQRINVVEPDGTLRLVISDRTRLPGVYVHGKETASEPRPYAGLIFLNDEGSENGGLIFAGHKNEKGEVADAGGSLTFDRYGASQEVQLMGVNDHEVRRAGLIIRDSPPGGPNQRRVFVGRGDDGVAQLALADAGGKQRLVLKVAPEGAASIQFLDSDGKVLQELPAAPASPR
ncbi:MAG TPA: hypothetical protein VGS57_02090 [Thermoanaerobaculia bacterium]|jgi:hypothetical protein|nr:hypothetical protein [Thermoanaerobaculia bacterium]